MLGSGSKGDSTKSLSQTFESRDSQMTKEDLTATLLKDFKEDFIFLFINPSERKQNRRDSEQNPLASTSTARQFIFHPFWENAEHKGPYFSNYPYFPHTAKSTPRELPACYVSKSKVCQVEESR